jgi:O-antigen/teichoic acid export membrane protein
MEAVSQLRDTIQRSMFVRDIGSLWSAQVVGATSAIIQGIIVARLLGPSRYGLAAVVIAVPSLVFVFLDARASDAAVRFLGEFHGRREVEKARAFWAVGMGLDLSAATATLAVVALIAIWAAHHLVHSAATTGLLVIYAGAMMIRAPASTSEACLVTLTRYRALSLTQASISLAKALISVAFVVASRTVAALVWGTAAGLVVEGLAMVGLATVVAGRVWGPWWRARIGRLRDRAREIAGFVVWADVSSLLGVAAKQADVVFVGALAGAAAAGFYRLASNFGQLSGFVIAPLQSVLYQRFSRLRATGSARAAGDAVRRAVLHVALPVGALGILVVPFAPWVIRATAGARYAPAGGVAQIMVLIGATWAFLLWVRPLAFSLDEVKLWAATASAIALFSLAGFAIAVPVYGALGAAWVRFAASLGAQIVPAAAIRGRYARGRYSDMFRPAEARGS